MTRGTGWAVWVIAVWGCGTDEAIEEDPGTLLPIEALMNPETCRECHPAHYEEWSGSMHAYAATDPVFLAMNERGQRETGGKLGAFCVNCHAPMAVRTGATEDGMNLAGLPPELQGVTCYFCHNVVSVDGTHNAQLSLAMDQRMRGGIRDPVKSGAHRSGYSPLLDNQELESASMCGACHDIVTSTDFAPAPVELERTFKEWQRTVFNRPLRAGGLSCSSMPCHMRVVRDEVVADAPNVFPRTRHNHEFPGVDIALTDFPERARQREAVEDFLDVSSLRTVICVTSVDLGTEIQVTIENLTGHKFPSGAFQDRRAWVELIATGEGQEYKTGVVPDGTAVTTLVGSDPDLWLLRDRVYDAEDHETHMFWNVARVEEDTIGGPITNLRDPDYGKQTQIRRFPRQGQLQFVPERVTLRVRVRPVGLDVIDDLAGTNLDPGVSDAIPTFDVLPERKTPEPPWPGTLTLEWTPALYANPSFGFEGDETAGVRPQCVSVSPPRQ